MLFYGVWIWIVGKRSKMLEVSWYDDCWGFSWLSFFLDCTHQRIWKLWELERLLRTSGVVQMSSYTSKIVPWSWRKPIRDSIIEYGKAYHTYQMSQMPSQKLTCPISDTLQKTWQWKITKFLIRRYEIYTVIYIYIHDSIVVFPFSCFFFGGL